MQDALTSLVRRSRNMENTKVNNSTKDKLIKDMNKYGKEYGFGRIDKNASLEQVRNSRNLFIERLGYDIVTLAIQEGNETISSIYGRDLKHSEDKDTKRLGEFAVQLAQAKKRSDMKLTKEEKEFLESANTSIKGYGNEDIITLFESTKSIKGAMDLIAEIKNQNPRDIYYDKMILTFERVFQKIGIYREEDIIKLTEKLKTLEFDELSNETNYLLQSLEIYGSEDNSIGKYGDEETELANARLDDVMIKLKLKNTGKKKVNKTLSKYKQSK